MLSKDSESHAAVLWQYYVTWIEYS